MTSNRVRRRISFALLFSLLPMLTFMGHWPSSFAVPGTAVHVSIPLAGAKHDSDDAHDHSQHCHGDSASCSDVPASAGMGFALLQDAVSQVTVGGLMLLLAFRWWLPSPGTALAPDLRPPRMAYHAFAF